MSEPAHAQVDPDELVGTYRVDAKNISGQGCSLAEREESIEVTSASDSSLRLGAQGDSVDLNFDPATGDISMTSQGVTIDGHFTRLSDEIRLNLALTTPPPFDCTTSIEASKPAASSGMSPQSAKDTPSPVNKAIEPPPPAPAPSGAEPSDEEVREALWGDDNNTLLLIAFLILLLGSAFLTLRQQQRLKAKGEKGSDVQETAKHRRQRKLYECRELGSKLSGLRREIDTIHKYASTRPWRGSQENVAYWQRLMERMRGDGQFHSLEIARQIGLEGEEALRFAKDPSAFIEQKISEAQDFVRRVQDEPNRLNSLEREADRLMKERADLGCDAAEKQAGGLGDDQWELGE